MSLQFVSPNVQEGSTVTKVDVEVVNGLSDVSSRAIALYVIGE